MGAFAKEFVTTTSSRSFVLEPKHRYYFSRGKLLGVLVKEAVATATVEVASWGRNMDSRVK